MLSIPRAEDPLQLFRHIAAIKTFAEPFVHAVIPVAIADACRQRGGFSSGFGGEGFRRHGGVSHSTMPGHSEIE
ncbi:hypothetical protein NM688_g6500 [Phlebia brevispora]|uniref:Uncharacterized protein n=1 Tax=Phlebia brevispora TaxID=194682 RepID=A0ACC1SFD7_9APHY|nr:hypothetical protein NM688_g6500 [Phlebia brevispora]